MNVETQSPSTEDKLVFLEQELIVVKRKRKKLITPLVILLGTAILIFIHSLLFWSSSVAFDLNDNIYKVKGSLYMGLMSVLLFLEWFCYWFSRKNLYSVLLARIHVILTCGICIGFMATQKSFIKIREIENIEASLIQTLLDGEVRFLELGSKTSWIFVVAQALFLFNWGSGNYSKNKMNQEEPLT